MGWSELVILSVVMLLGLFLSSILIKPLNGMLLGEWYARGLGVSVERTRMLILLVTGLFAGGITAFCGPLAFVGVAVPHLARGLFSSTDHRLILPACALLGADLLLCCDVLCNIFTYPVPISTMSALFGAPVIIWIILKNK